MKLDHRLILKERNSGFSTGGDEIIVSSTVFPFGIASVRSIFGLHVGFENTLVYCRVNGDESGALQRVTLVQSECILVRFRSKMIEIGA